MRGPAKHIAFLAAFLSFLPPGPLAAAAPARVRVGICLNVHSLQLGQGQYAVRNPSVKNSERQSFSQAVTLAAGPTGLSLNKKSYGKRLLVEPVDPDGRVILNGRPFRGGIEFIWGAKDRLTAVNVLPVDDYVRGILPHEVSERWPKEALRAQAVVSRTYALRNLGRHGKEGFDFCATDHCQVYGGRGAEKEATDQAVRDTQGKALYHEGQLISAVFHSCCGGRTEEAQNVWEKGGAPYLKSVRCRWCRGCPRFEWAGKVKPEALSKRLNEAGHRVGEVKAIRVLSRSRSGRAYMVRVEGSEGSAEMRASQFRLLADGRLVQSTFWSAFGKKGGGWEFHGNGWGHGVGLCQWGAKAMGESGQGYAQILRFYYKGVSVGKVKN